jgi:hypothetical protein
MIHQSSVTTFCRGSKETRASSNNMLRAAEGRGDEPAKSDTPICHSMGMVTQIMVATTPRHHRIHDGMCPFWFEEVWEL